MQSVVSRRRFLQHSAALGAAGIALPYFIPAGVLASDAAPGANERIVVAGIGVGRRGKQVADALLHHAPLVRIAAVADVYDNHAQDAAKKIGALQGAAPQVDVYKDYHRILERRDIEAIFTATPDPWRSLVCIESAQAGKDIYGEKPLTLTLSEGRKMVEAARKYDRVFQTGSHQRSMVANRFGCELIRNGGLGKISKVVCANYASPWECALPEEPIPVGLDWNAWCGPNEVVPFHKSLFASRSDPGWLSFRPYTGGEVTNWGAHGLDQIQWALGMDESGPVEIWTDGQPFEPPTYGAPESRARGDKLCAIPKVSLRYASGVVVVFGDGNPGGGIFIGEKGRLEISRGRLAADPPELIAELGNRNVPPPPKIETDAHVLNWLECVKSRQRPAADVEIGHRSASVCHLANIARWVNRRLQWDPSAERFVDDEAANALLTRPRRKGFELPAV